MVTDAAVSRRGYHIEAYGCGREWAVYAGFAGDRIRLGVVRADGKADALRLAVELADVLGY